MDEDEIANSMNFEIAYVLLLFFGTFGVHHAYLGRHAHALVYFLTFGLFGWGILVDIQLLPEYVSLARSDPKDETFRRLTNIMEMHLGVPPRSFLRILGMLCFGSIFGFLCSCVVPPHTQLPIELVSLLVTITKAVGSSVGIYMIANVGSVAISRPYTHLFFVCMAGSLIRYPVVSCAGYANYYRVYRPSMMPKSRLPRRLGKYVLLCSGCICLFFLVIFIQLGISFQIINNVRKSEFFKEFDFAEFQSGRYNSNGGEGRTDNLKNVFDLEGERVARNALGVSRTASIKEIKSAYKELARQYHPDKIKKEESDTGTAEGDKNQKFIKIQEAYETLKKIEKRRENATNKKNKANFRRDEM